LSSSTIRIAPGTATILAVALAPVNLYAPPAVAEVLDSKVLDDLRASVGGDQAFFAELVDELLDDAPRQLASLRESAARGDAEGARRAAHTLKGNGRTFGAEELSALGLELESAAAGGDLDAVLARAGALEEAWERTRAALLVARDAAA
jgi:HPt (histidine-containing phosphotransfer) domain-containing protein